jgi:hypothetical protein
VDARELSQSALLAELEARGIEAWLDRWFLLPRALEEAFLLLSQPNVRLP